MTRVDRGGLSLKMPDGGGDRLRAGIPRQPRMAKHARSLPVSLVRRGQCTWAGSHGFSVGWTSSRTGLVGIKSREFYETPGPVA